MWKGARMTTKQSNYDANNLDDPLRHRYLERAVRSSIAVPLRVKVAAGLGIEPPTEVQMISLRYIGRLFP